MNNWVTHISLSKILYTKYTLGRVKILKQIRGYLVAAPIEVNKSKIFYKKICFVRKAV